MMLKNINLKTAIILLLTHVAIFSAGVYYGLLVYEAYIEEEYIVIPESMLKQEPTKIKEAKRISV